METTTNDHFGLDLLINPKKKNSETMSIVSLGSSKKDARSVKSSMSHKSSSKKHRQSYSDDADSIISSLSSSSAASSSLGSTSVSSSSSESSSHMTSIGSSIVHKKVTQEEIMDMKKELLYQFDRMERKGFKVPKKFTLASSLEEMKMEYERLKNDREAELSIRFQRKIVLTLVTGVEFLNKKFDPFDIKLDGWSESVNDSINDFDEVFEELHQKYKSKAKVAPEIKLAFLLMGSGVMFHLTNTMFKSSLPGLDQVMKQNPDLMKQFASATVNTMAANQQNAAKASNTSSGFGGIGSIIGSLFGFGGGGGAPTAQATRPNRPRPQMKGPTNVDEILSELNRQPEINDNDRVEIVSTYSESEISELQDDGSQSGVFPSTLKKANQRRTLNI